MTEEKSIRLSKAARELNVSIPRIMEFLTSKGHKVEHNPNTKLTEELHHLLMKEFQPDMLAREESEHKSVSRIRRADEQAAVPAAPAKPAIVKTEAPPPTPVEEEPITPKKKTAAAKIEKAEPEIIKAKTSAGKKSPVIIGKVDVDAIAEANKGGKKKKSIKKAKETEQAGEPPVTATPVAEVPPASSAPEVAPEEPKVDKPKEVELFRTKRDVLAGPTIMGKINLPVEPPKRKGGPSQSAATAAEDAKKKKRKRKSRVGSSSDAATQFKPDERSSTGQRPSRDRGGYGNQPAKAEPTANEIHEQIKQTLQKLTGSGKSRASKHRKQKRADASHAAQEQVAVQESQKNILKVTEFLSANEFAKMMNIPVTKVISSCLTLGLFVSINQRLDAETISIVAEEFGYKVEFVTVEENADLESEQTDSPDSLKSRPPIVTVMGHVDHGKTSLLDHIRKANVIAGEAGGITQHIGAYEVTLESGKHITFLDTPGHEAFTAMRARGAKVTDLAIIVVAADDSVMPQTIEAINHAQAASVPIIFAINKIDKPGAAPEKIKEQLAQMNYLVEDWGGKYQCQEISAKKGLNIDQLLEKVLLESELLELKANPVKNAVGTVIESTLDKGRGYVTTVLVQAGTLKIGDVMLAGMHSGRVKAMFNERGGKVDLAGPSTPVLVLGMSGAPQAGDSFKVVDDEREAREIANKRSQLVREQGIRTHKHITLDEIGRRLAIGNFKELNIIVKGDVDGSIEALADSLLKLSNPETQINVIHKSVGQISESDVLLASASNAIIVGFQVRPSLSARKLAETEQIDVRLYSVIYKAIEEIKAAMEGMLAPEFVEKITSNVEIRDVFKITKVGTVAGCMVLDGKITRQTGIRVIRDGIVVFTGHLSSLKRFKDDAREVNSGYECGLSIENFNDIKVGDIIEGYEQVEVKRKIA